MVADVDEGEAFDDAMVARAMRALVALVRVNATKPPEWFLDTAAWADLKAAASLSRQRALLDAVRERDASRLVADTAEAHVNGCFGSEDEGEAQLESAVREYTAWKREQGRALVEARRATALRDCTCLGSCKGADGLANGWRCGLTGEEGYRG